jgi:hypothetical protein
VSSSRFGTGAHAYYNDEEVVQTSDDDYSEDEDSEDGYDRGQKSVQKFLNVLAVVRPPKRHHQVSKTGGRTPSSSPHAAKSADVKKQNMSGPLLPTPQRQYFLFVSSPVYSIVYPLPCTLPSLIAPLVTLLQDSFDEKTAAAL